MRVTLKAQAAAAAERTFRPRGDEFTVVYIKKSSNEEIGN